MAAGKEEKKDDKGKDKTEGKEEKKKDDSDQVITAIYRVDLHCQECGSKVKKHLMTTQGVQKVDIDIEKGEIKAKGKFDPLKILKLIEKKSKKKVELISLKVKPKESTTTTDNKPKETKDEMAAGKEEKKDDKGKDKTEGKEEKKKEDSDQVITAIYRVDLHCQECGSKVKKHLMTTQGVQNVDIDIEKGEIKAKGKLDPLKILKLIEEKSKKKVELISPKVKPKESTTTTDNKPKETKDEMAAGKEEKKDDKGKDKTEGKEEKKKEDSDQVITAIYRVNLHCQECGSKVKKHLMTTPGVQNVDINIEKGEIKAKGKLDPLKILKLIEKKSKKKVELISPKVKPKESTTTTDNKPKETKDPIIRTISVKVHMHCDKCEADLKQRLIKHKGIFNVKTDKKAQSVTVEGTIEVEKLLSFMRKRVHKNAVVISIKEEKKEEKKEKGKEEGKSSETTKDKNGSTSGESTKKKDDNKPGESTKEKEGKSSESTKDKNGSTSGESTKKKDDNKPGESTKEREGKSSESTKEKEDSKSSETTKTKENVPYIIHYVYAPQLFSDENPNSCSIL